MTELFFEVATGLHLACCVRAWEFQGLGYLGFENLPPKMSERCPLVRLFGCVHVLMSLARL